MEQHSPLHTIIKTPNTQNKERVLKVLRVKPKPDRMWNTSGWFQWELWKVEMSVVCTPNSKETKMANLDYCIHKKIFDRIVGKRFFFVIQTGWENACLPF